MELLCTKEISELRFFVFGTCYEICSFYNPFLSKLEHNAKSSILILYTSILTMKGNSAVLLDALIE